MIDNPIIDSIRQIQEQGRTGSLPLQKSTQTIVLTFRDGLIDAAGSNIADLRLGNIFSRKGVIKTAAIPHLLEKARRRRMILGRAAIHMGRVITWDEALASEFQFFPGIDNLTPDSAPPVQSDADGRYPVPVPGKWVEI